IWVLVSWTSRSSIIAMTCPPSISNEDTSKWELLLFPPTLKRRCPAISSICRNLFAKHRNNGSRLRRPQLNGFRDRRGRSRRESVCDQSASDLPHAEDLLD